ncbi:hypothetical protein [Streptomyces sp. NPDC058657]|uniref:hypothetical protein n=1 Tax=unclassified Streptomyces TaxID=2593676 RepID=UPI00365B8934
MIPVGPVTMALSALLSSASGKPVGRGRRPATFPPPYYLLHLVDVDTTGPPLEDLNEDISLVYQVTCVSGPDPNVQGSAGSDDQAQWLADKARTALLGRNPATGAWLHPLTVSGAKVMGRRPETEPGGTSDPADAIMSHVLRVRVDLTPA